MSAGVACECYRASERAPRDMDAEQPRRRQRRSRSQSPAEKLPAPPSRDLPPPPIRQSDAANDGALDKQVAGEGKDAEQAVSGHNGAVAEPVEVAKEGEGLDDAQRAQLKAAKKAAKKEKKVRGAMFCLPHTSKLQGICHKMAPMMIVRIWSTPYHILSAFLIQVMPLICFSLQFLSLSRIAGMFCSCRRRSATRRKRRPGRRPGKTVEGAPAVRMRATSRNQEVMRQVAAMQWCSGEKWRMI